MYNVMTLQILYKLHLYLVTKLAIVGRYLCKKVKDVET